MPRALWKGAITFGLVHVPVNLYSGTKSESVGFDMIDKRDFAPIGYKRYNKSTGKEVDNADIVKGYEYEKGEYVVITDEDFKLANVKATQTVEIVAFVKSEEVEPYYFDTPYYLEPGKRGEKGYALLRDVLKKTGYVGVAQVVIRSRQHIAAVIPVDRVLVLNLLRYSYEIRDTKELELPETGKAAGVSDKEMEMAKRLIDDMAEKWRPEQYKDTYHDDLMARIKEKIKAGETHVITEPGAAPEPPRSAEIIDLAALLRRSLEKKGKGTGKGDGDAENEPADQRQAATSKSVSTKRAHARKPKAKERKRA